MSEVQTVRGPVDGADLGVTLMEERVADAIARLQ
jgi:predicted metal-dependent phosphotriesterase family hydrolase